MFSIKFDEGWTGTAKVDDRGWTNVIEEDYIVL